MLTAVVVATLLVSATVLAPGVAEAGFRDPALVSFADRVLHLRDGRLEDGP
jgi:hypothetical protein